MVNAVGARWFQPSRVRIARHEHRSALALSRSRLAFRRAAAADVCDHVASGLSFVSDYRMSRSAAPATPKLFVREIGERKKERDLFISLNLFFFFGFGFWR